MVSNIQVHRKTDSPSAPSLNTAVEEWRGRSAQLIGKWKQKQLKNEAKEVKPAGSPAAVDGLPVEAASLPLSATAAPDAPEKEKLQRFPQPARCRVATGTGDSVQLADVDSVVPLPLPLTRLPVAVPVVIGPSCRTACVDPDCNEEAAAAASYIAGLDAHGELCFSQSCGEGLDPESLQTCLALAKARAKQLHSYLEQMCKEADEAWRQTRIDLVRNSM